MIKIITGYRKDQAFSVAYEEAHKAYYLFFNPDARTVFSNGLAIKGSDIDRIEPDYQGVMGWNPTHSLDEDDMNEIRSKGVDKKIGEAMARAKDAARLCSEADLNLPLPCVIEKFPELATPALLPTSPRHLE
jgi:hypothetical protein